MKARQDLTFVWFCSVCGRMYDHNDVDAGGEVVLQEQCCRESIREDVILHRSQSESETHP